MVKIHLWGKGCNGVANTDQCLAEGFMVFEVMGKFGAPCALLEQGIF